MEQLDPIIVMQQETQRSEGIVPSHCGGQEVLPGHYVMTEDEFLLRSPDGAAFHYRRGHGVIMQCEDANAREEADLWFSGSVYSAIAAINGLTPLHASALQIDGKIVAITGLTGAGKSTLVAALMDRDMPLFCDDTLVVQSRSGKAGMCLPGHKRLKLDADAARLTGAEMQEAVASSIAKNYAKAVTAPDQFAAPLDTLIVLREGEQIEIAEISAGEAIAALLQDHYTVDYGQLASAGGRQQYWQTISGIVSSTYCVAFTRPKDRTRFTDSLQAMRDFLKGRFPS